MKLIKEMPPSIYHSLRLASIPVPKSKERNKKQLDAIISFTSIPSRLKTLHLVIRSLLVQEYQPKKIILWLNEGIKSQIPDQILKLQSDIFEIGFSDLNCSHRKLIHSIDRFPEDLIITCDDDVIYRKNWLHLLYEEHKKNPDKIVGNKTYQVGFDQNGRALPYQSWKSTEHWGEHKKAVVAIGSWGILYPPQSLDKRVLDSDLFLRLSPHSDDLWFKAMALLNDTLSIQAEQHPEDPIPIIGTQGKSLKKINVNKELNDIQWSALSEYFGLNKLILDRIAKK